MNMRIGTPLMLALTLCVGACGDDTPATTNGNGSSSTGEPGTGTTETPTPPATTEGSSSSGPGMADTSSSGGTSTGEEGTTSGTSTGEEGTTSGTSTGDEGTTSGTSTGGESSSDTGMVGPGECNEMLGVPCVGMFFCDYPDDNCGAGANGMCQPIPGGFCPANFDPQCGCDGLTHSNECVANSNGTDIEHAGAC